LRSWLTSRMQRSLSMEPWVWVISFLNKLPKEVGRLFWTALLTKSSDWKIRNTRFWHPKQKWERSIVIILSSPFLHPVSRRSSLHLNWVCRGKWSVIRASQDLSLGFCFCTKLRSGSKKAILVRYTLTVLSINSLQHLMTHDLNKMDNFSLPLLCLSMQQQPGIGGLDQTWLKRW
jgi:hypothetical protein